MQQLGLDWGEEQVTGHQVLAGCFGGERGAPASVFRKDGPGPSPQLVLGRRPPARRKPLGWRLAGHDRGLRSCSCSWPIYTATGCIVVPVDCSGEDDQLGEEGMEGEL